jgi:hypothetical protein
MSNWQAIRNEAEEILDRHSQHCIEIVPQISFNNTDPQHVLALCLYCSIIELCPSLLILIQHGQFTGIPSLIRSMYEADVDLVNTLKDRDYFQSLHATYLTKMISVIQEAHNSEAPGFMKASGGIVEMRILLKKLRKRLAVIKAAGHGPLKNVDRFRRAERDEDYITAYAYLCRYTHNDIRALQSRHLRSDGDKVELKVFERLGPENETHLIDLADAVLLGASGRVHIFFDSGCHEEIESMFDERNTMRGKWPKEET